MNTEEVERLFLAAFLNEHPIFGERYARGIFHGWLNSIEVDDGPMQEEYQRGFDDGWNMGWEAGESEGYTAALYEGEARES